MCLYQWVITNKSHSPLTLCPWWGGEIAIAEMHLYNMCLWTIMIDVDRSSITSCVVYYLTFYIVGLANQKSICANRKVRKQVQDLSIENTSEHW